MNRTLHAWKGISYRLLLEDISNSVNNFILSLSDYLKDTVEHLILSCILYIIICIFLYFCIVKWSYLQFNRDVRNSKRVLFVIAHPDDECMFFGPTILNYTRKENCLVYLICLSTGTNYGMGSTRKKELYNSCKVLGIEESNIFIHSHTLLPDSMDVKWPPELISQLVSQYVDSLNITTLITFDRHGISSHKNHSSIYYAIANLILDGKLPKCCGVYVLESVNIIRKYWLLLDLPISYILSRFRYTGGFGDRKTILQAMKEHKSQLLWFRYFYMSFSRYMLMNTLQQMNLVDVELDLELDD